MNPAVLRLTTITNEHFIPLQNLCEELNTSLQNGINGSFAKKILTKNGKNKLKFNKSISFEKNGSFSSLPGSRKKKDKGFSKSEWKKLFNKCLPKETTVIRDGIRKNILTEHLVKGDLVILENGDKVPADMRIVYAENLAVDNKLISGNNCELRSHLAEYIEEDCLISSNMLFACTKILTGECVAIVLRTGEETVFGTLKDFATKVKVSSSVRSSSTEDEEYEEPPSPSYIRKRKSSSV